MKNATKNVLIGSGAAAVAGIAAAGAVSHTITNYLMWLRWTVRCPD